MKVKTFMATDRVHALRQVILAARKGGRVSIPGVYGGIADKFPIGALMEKGLQIKSGQTHVQKFMPELLQMILDGRIDTTFLISHRLDLEDRRPRATGTSRKSRTSTPRWCSSRDTRGTERWLRRESHENRASRAAR